jgi:hypothetical protein
VTNLDFVELLLKRGADPNAQKYLGRTPLIHTIPDAPGAAKFLLNWPTTDVNTTMRSGESFLAEVRKVVQHFAHQVARLDDPYEHRFQLLQWQKIDEMLVERGAIDTGMYSNP